MEHLNEGIPETMLIPLWARAEECKEKGPIFQDTKSKEILSAIDYDFSKFSTSRKTQTGVAIRTLLFDEQVNRFFRQKTSPVIINLGAGLDTRISRFKEYSFHHWYDLDLPESIGIRRQFFSESECNSFISQSIFDYSWIDKVNTSGSKNVLIIAEGLLMYFEEKKVKELFQHLAEAFPGAEILFEMLAPFLVGKSKKHDSVKHTVHVPEFLWSVKDTYELETYHPSLAIRNEWNYFDYHKKRWGLLGVIARLPLIRTQFASRIVHADFL